MPEEIFANSSDIARFVFYSYGAGPVDIYYDELRMGATWSSVTPVPEPASVLLLGIGAMLLTGRRRNRRPTVCRHDSTDANSCG